MEVSYSRFMCLAQIQIEITAKPQKVRRMCHLCIWHGKGGGSGKEFKAPQAQANIIFSG